MKNKVLLTVIWNLIKLLPWCSWIELSLSYLDKKAKKTETEIDDFVLMKLRDFYLRLQKSENAI
jgi:hypothetical protein